MGLRRDWKFVAKRFDLSFSFAFSYDRLDLLNFEILETPEQLVSLHA